MPAWTPGCSASPAASPPTTTVRPTGAERLRARSRTPPGAGPAELVETRDEHATLRAEFDQLPAGDRELLELRVVAGLSPDDVAAVLGKRPGAVRTAQSRALGRLRTRLARREGGGS